VKILDTNLWVFGTLRTNEQAAEFLAQFDRGETTSAINAYMVQEALAAFDRTQSLSATDRDTVKTNFLTQLTRMTGLIFELSRKPRRSRRVRMSLAEFEPAGHSLPEITIEHVP
jgi:hypothetical protein